MVSLNETKDDFVADLFESLVETLEDDPTPVEILVADDGSTDDSLHACRVWAEKTWKTGERFCTLEESEHTGVLSVVANRLTARARGDICCRLDGDIVVNTPVGNGSAPVTPAFAEEIGADAYGYDASNAVTLIKEMAGVA